VGIEVTAKRYGNYDVTLTIPLDDLDTSTALMKHDEEPIPGNLQYGMNLPADEAWDIVRKDVKLLGLVALAAHTREFAQYVNVIYQAIEDGRNYPFEVGDFSDRRGDIHADHIGDNYSWKNDRDFLTIWLLPYLDGFM